MNIESINQIPGYIYNEYKIVLYPNVDLSDKIRKIKRDFSKEYKTEIIIESKPALTLVTFVQFEIMEHRLINRFKIIATGFSPIKVELNGFGSLPTHSIFINIASIEALQKLTRELNATRQLMTLNKENKPHFISNPHFIIAWKLLPWQYEKAWLHFSHQHFTSRFIAGEMTLLKRSLSNSMNGKEEIRGYQKVGTYTFENLPKIISQGDLFS